MTSFADTCTARKKETEKVEAILAHSVEVLAKGGKSSPNNPLRMAFSVFLASVRVIGHQQLTPHSTSKAEVSTDGGTSWQEAQLNEPLLPKALTRFRLPWWWDGRETSLQSRCTDQTGYLQPTRDELVAVRGLHATDHYNGIKIWYVHTNGEVSHV